MESDSADVLVHSDSEIQEHECDVPSKELTDLSCSQERPLKGDKNLSSDIVLEHPNLVTSFRNGEEISNFVESFCYDPLYPIVSDNNLTIIENAPEKSCEKINEVFEKKLIGTEAKCFNIELLSEETEVTKSTISGETGSTKVIQPALSEETGSTEVIQPALSEETGSTEVIQPALSEETESTEVIQPALSEETESTEVIQPALSEETGSIELIQPTLSVDTGSTDVMQPAFSAKTVSVKIKPAISTNLIQSSNLEETSQSTQNIPKCSESNNKSKVLSYGIKRSRISSDTTVNSTSIQESLTESFNVLGLKLQNLKNSLDSSHVTAKEMDNFQFSQYEGFERGTNFVISGSDCGGQVSSSPRPLFKPIFPDFQMPVEVSPESRRKINSATLNNLSSETTLSDLVNILVDWINRGMDIVFNKPDNINIKDFLDHSEDEFRFGLEVLKQMIKRVHLLLKAVIHIPDPPNLFSRFGSNSSFLIRQDINDTGIKLWCRLEALETEITEDFNNFLSASRHFSVLNYERDANISMEDECVINQLKASALRIISNSYVRVSEENSIIFLEIDNFHNKIREFYSVIYKFL